MKSILNDTNMLRYPFRGILAEIAREDGVTRQCIQKAARRGNPDIVRRIIAKVEERRQDLERLQRELQR